MLQFTKDEVKMLFEGLDSIVSAKRSSNAMGGIFGAIVMGRDEETRAKFEQQQKEKNEKLDEEISVLEEKIVLLKAKLIQMKDRIAVEEVLG